MDYHFIGIGGIGMSGLAKILLQRGKRVRGSDIASSWAIEELEQEGAEIFIKHEACQVPAGAKVVYSSGIQLENVEYVESKKQSLPLLHRSDLLQELMEEKEALLVTGTHGKTTTSSLLAHVLAFCGEEPSFCVGGVVESLGSQSGLGKGPLFVAEADESDGSFLAYSPKGAIMTNIEAEHLAYWKSEEKLIQGFLDFYHKVSCKELFFWCADDAILASLSLEGISYGFTPSADLHIEEVTYQGWKTKFSFTFKGCRYDDVEIPMVGVHNVLNASAVIGLCLQIGIEKDKIFSSLKTFAGARRRSEKKGEEGNISVYDDYAHHPTEIHTTLNGICVAGAGRRVVVLFQPHKFTRVRDCFSLFGPAFASADLVLITDIYGAGEEPIVGVDSKALVEEVIAQGGVVCKYIPKEKVVEETLIQLNPEDIVITMGAGDITKVGPLLLKRLSDCQ
jgi:UDP-N-acetylmuramate--alanine ligase